MSLVGETTFSKIGDLYCKCEWPPVEEGEMFLTLIHSDSAWTAILDKNSLDFGPRAADYEQVQHGIVTWSLAIMIKLKDGYMVHGKNHPLIVMVGPILCLTCALYLGFDQDFERGFLWRIRKLFD